MAMGVGTIIIEGINVYLDTIRKERQINISKSFFVLHQTSETIKFGNLRKVSWKIYYTRASQTPLFELSTVGKADTDDYNRELGIKLQAYFCTLLQNIDTWNKIIDGKYI